MDIKWTGNVRDLVATVAGSDARTTYIDKSGAKIRINIDGVDEDAEWKPWMWGKSEPFYIESPDGENLYDAYNRKEAVVILSNIRKGSKYPDQPDYEPKHKTAKPKSKRKASRTGKQPVSMRGMR